MLTNYEPTVIKVRGYDNLIASRRGFKVWRITNEEVFVHNEETDEIISVSHSAILCYWFKGQWVYVQTAKGGLVCVKQLN